MSARRLTLRRDGVGPHQWTIPNLIYLDRTRGVLIRRFELLQSIDRTQFEGGRKRHPGELSRWAGHGQSKLRISITVEDVNQDSNNDLDEDEDDYDGFYSYRDSYYDSDSDGTLVSHSGHGHRYGHGHHRTLSSEMKAVGAWAGDDAYFNPDSMDIDEQLRLF